MTSSSSMSFGFKRVEGLEKGLEMHPLAHFWCVFGTVSRIKKVGEWFKKGLKDNSSPLPHLREQLASCPYSLDIATQKGEKPTAFHLEKAHVS
mmetsp:Transcript_87238/g.151785  ORF Transcript_87238/g.151785 Transcript_87238/m.151785 type:complete len:93 (+) Transcript_87238:119-397(+)